MIHEVFNLLKDKLNTYFKTIGQQENKVDFVKATDDDETIKFQLNQITPVLINIEEERVMRSPDLYRSRAHVGMVNVENTPEIRINLLVLFVSKFGNYTEGLNYLSHVIKFFQVNRVFDHHNSPTLSTEIEKLIMELSPPVLQEQDAVWNALRTSYLPSVLYKIKMLVYLDKESLRAASQISNIEFGLAQKSSSTQVTYQVVDLDMDISQTNAPPLPRTNVPVDGSASSVIDYNTSATIHVKKAEEGVTYQLHTPEKMPSGEAVACKSDGEVIILTSDKLLVDTEFKVKATNIATGGETYLNNTVTIFVLPRTYEISLAGPDSVDSGETATIELTNAQKDVRYQLKVDGNNSGGPEDCAEEEGTVSLTSDTLIETGYVIFEVEATTISGGKSAILDDTITIEVLDGVDTGLTVSGPPITTYSQGVTIVVKDSQEGVEYRLKGSNGFTSTPVSGNGGDRELDSDNLTDDTTFTVEASSNDGVSWTPLNNTHTVMVGRLRFALNAGDTSDTIDFKNPLDLVINSNTQTIEMWIKPDNLEAVGGQYLYFKGNTPSGNIHIEADGTVNYVYHSDLTTPDWKLSIGQSLNSNEWIHLAVTRNTGIGGRAQWYVNGEPDGDGLDISEKTVSGDDECTIIGGTNGSYEGYIGLIAEVRVWSVARTAEQIKNNINKRLDNPEGEDGLVAYWKLDEGTGTTVDDSSVNDFTGTIHNAEWIG